MKISPIVQSSGQPGQALGSVDVGRTADPIKMERARAIARGEKVSEQPESPRERIAQDVRKLKMRTNFSTNREEPVTTNVVEDAPPATTNVVQPEGEPAAAESSTPDAAEPGAVEATQPLSPQFAALAKQKRALQLERAEFDKQKAELEQLRGTQSPSDLIAKLKSDPLSVLQEHGVTYDQLTDAILNGNQSDPAIQELKKEIEALKKGVETQFQTREQAQEEAALTEMLYQAEALAKEGDAFEMIRSENAYDQVLRLIHSTYKQSGRVLDVTEAMNQIENKLLERAEKLASINKVRNKLVPPAPIQPPLQPQQRQMRTLTARDSAAPVSDRRARAMAAFSGTLKR